MDAIPSTNAERKAEVIRLMKAEPRDIDAIFAILRPYIETIARNRLGSGGPISAVLDEDAYLSKAWEKTAEIIDSPDTKPEGIYGLLAFSLKNAFADMERLAKVRKATLHDSIEGQAYEDGDEKAADIAEPALPSTRVSRASMRRVVDMLSEHLSGDDLRVMHAHLTAENKNMTGGQVAASLGMTPGAYYCRLHRARAHLQGDFKQRALEELTPSASERGI